MTDGEITAALEAVLAAMRPVDVDKAARALKAWLAGDLVLTHTLVSEIVWGYWLSNDTAPDGTCALQLELAGRRRALGLAGHPHDFDPPSRYGHLQG